LRNEKGIILGLFLTEKETSLFDPEQICAHTAVGIEGALNIIAYQLNLGVCPHISEKNECKIYDRRPLACQSFPIETTPLGNLVNAECPQAGSLIRNPELVFSEAGEKILRYLGKGFAKYGKRGSKLWYFNLGTKRWVVMSDSKIAEWISENLGSSQTERGI
jgi:Fe-S-cluster containining protein